MRIQAVGAALTLLGAVTSSGVAAETLTMSCLTDRPEIGTDYTGCRGRPGDFNLHQSNFGLTIAAEDGYVFDFLGFDFYYVDSTFLLLDPDLLPAGVDPYSYEAEALFFGGDNFTFDLRPSNLAVEGFRNDVEIDAFTLDVPNTDGGFRNPDPTSYSWDTRTYSDLIGARSVMEIDTLVLTFNEDFLERGTWKPTWVNGDLRAVLEHIIVFNELTVELRAAPVTAIPLPGAGLGALLSLAALIAAGKRRGTSPPRPQYLSTRTGVRRFLHPEGWAADA